MDCIVVYNGKEYSHAEFMSMLHDGLLDKFVNDGVVDITPPTTKEPDFESAGGEKRQGRRSKRIEQQEEYKSKLESYSREYTSVNIDAIKPWVNDYISSLTDMVAKDGWKKANDRIADYLKSLVVDDTTNLSTDRVFAKTAFAILTAQSLAADAMKRGDTKSLTFWNDFLTAIGRQQGVGIAMQNSDISNDPLLNLFNEISARQNEAIQKTTKSGRTKKEIIEEIQDEVDAIKKDAVNEVVNDETLDEDITKVTEKEQPQPTKKPTSKRTKLVKERNEAIEALKRLARSQGFAATPQQGGKRSKELADAVIKIAKVEIQLGAYTLKEAVSKVYKQVRDFVSKQDVEDIVSEIWESELNELSKKARTGEALDILTDAIEGKSSDRLIKALGKAIRISNPDFIKAQKKGRRMTDAQAIAEILNNKEQAEVLLNQAIELLYQEMLLDGKHLDTVQATKPSSLSDEQWNALRAKYIISKYKMFVNNVLGKDVSEVKTSEVSKVVKEIAKDFYTTENSNQSLEEAIQEKLPQMSIEQVKEIAELVKQRMKKLVESRDNRRIKALVQEITDGKEDSDMMRVLAKTMWNRGAMGSPQFINQLSNYLGFKGVPINVINQLVNLLQTTANLPNSTARQMAMRKVNNIATTYGETGWSFWHGLLTEVIVRNTLGAIKTGFTGTLSVVFSLLPSIGKQFIIRPVKASRAMKTTVNNFFTGKYALKAAARDIFLNQAVPHNREIPRPNNPYAKDTQWVRTRQMSWGDVKKIWESNKGKAISLAVGKTLINANFQGRYIGFANGLFNFMNFIDYMTIATMRDFSAAIEVQRKMEADGVYNGFAMTQAQKDAYLQSLSLNDSQLQAIEKQVNDEIAAMAQAGLPIPKGYKSKRGQELRNENMGVELMAKAHQKALEATMMNDPQTLVGNSVYAIFNAAQKLGKPEIEGQMNAVGFAMSMPVFALTLFGRIAIVLGESSTRYIPLFSPILNMFPYSFTLKNGSPIIKRDENGEKILRPKDDPREYAYRITASTAVTAMVAMFLAYAFDDEEVVGEDGKPVTVNGEKLYRQRYRLGQYIDFYGNSPTVGQEEKGVLPRNVIRIFKGKDANGDAIYLDIPIETTTPFLYGTLKALCEKRDAQRYFDEKVGYGMKDLSDTELVKEMNSAPRVDIYGLASSSGINSFNADFSSIARIVNGISAEKGVQAFVETVFIQPAKRVVSPRQVEEVAHQIQAINGQEKIYQNYKMEDDGMEGIVAYLMKDVWFTDPFIPERENLESVDYFGFPISFPPMYSDFLGMFGTTTTYALAEHEQKYKEYYNLYKGDDGMYDPQKATYPERFIYTHGSVDENGIVRDVNFDKNVQRRIADEAYRNFKVNIDTYGLSDLQSLSFRERMEMLELLWSWAKHTAVVTVVKNSTKNPPSPRPKDYLMPNDIERMNNIFLQSN